MDQPSQSSLQIILNVDGTDATRYARSRTLTEAGYRVLEAATGEEALLMVAALRPQLVVLDVNLPRMNGPDVCRRIKADPDSAHVMVLQVSAARTNHRDATAGLDGSADGYLIEPIDPLELVATVRALLRLSERHAENRRLAERLSRLERQFAEATDAADCGVWDWDVRSGRLEWLGKAERLAGLRPGGFSGKIEGFLEVLHAEDRERVWGKVCNLIARRADHFEDEHRYIHPDGSVHWMSAVGRFVYDESGQAVRMTGVVQDITQRKFAELRQQLESERRRLLSCAAEQLLVTDNPADLMTGVFETVRRHLDLDGYFYYRVDEAASALFLAACAGVPDELRTAFTHVDFGQGLCGTAAQRRTPEIWERLHDSHDARAQGVRALGFRACTCHPLIVGDRLLGTLAFASQIRDRFEQDEIAFMQSICRYVAAAMDRLRLEAETKERAERLRLSEEHLRVAMELNPQIPWMAKPDGSIEGINERWLQLSGLTREQSFDDSWMRLQHPQDLPRMITAWTHAIRTGEAYDIEHRIKPRTGGYRWMHSRAFPHRDSEGRIVCWYGTTEDIHDRKLAEEALDESREGLRGALQFCEAVMANIKEGLYTVDTDGLVTYVNPAAETLLGWSAQELLGRRMHDVIHYQHRDGSIFAPEECAGLQVLRRGTTLVEHDDVFIRKDGTFIDVKCTSAPMWSGDRVTGLVMVFRDVSAKRKIERSLVESEERFRTMAQAVPSFLFETDAQGWNTWTSEGWCRFTGQTQEQVRGHGWADALHPDDRAANIGRWTQCMRDGVPFESRQRLRRIDGSYAWVMAKALPVRNERGEVCRWLGSVTDVDELIRSEEALRESEERFRQIAETTDYVFWVTELNPERVLYASPAFEEIWQRPTSDVYEDARVWSKAIVPEDQGRVIEAFERWLADPDRAVFDVEYRIRRPDGTVRWIADEGCVIRDAAGRVYRMTGIARDITAMKDSEIALRESEERLRLALEVGRIGHWEWDARQNRIVWSDQLVAMYGFGPEDFGETYQGFLGRLHEEDRDLVRRAVGDAISAGGDYEAEFRFVRADGSVRWSLTKGRVHCDADGGVVRMNGVDMDITDRKRAEEQLKEQARLDSFNARIGKHLIESRDLTDMLHGCTQTMVDDLSAAFARIWTLNEQDNVLELQASSGLYTNLEGRHARVPVGSLKIGLIAAERKPNLTNHVMGDPHVPEQEWARREGMVAFAGYPLVVEDRVVGVMAMFSRHPLSESTLEAMSMVADHIALGITRKRAEKALQESEERLRLALDASLAGTWSWDVAANRSVWDERYYRLYGFEAQESPSFDAWIARVHPADRERLLARVQWLLRATGDDNWNEEFRAFHPGKGERWIQALGRVERDDDGKAVRFAGINLDVTERKRAEQALAASEQRMRFAMQAARMASWDWDVRTGHCMWSDLHFTLLGYEPNPTGEATLEMWVSRLHPDDRDRVMAEIEAAKLDHRLYRLEFRAIRADDGEIVWLSATGQFFYDEHGAAVRSFGVFYDITERNLAEEALRQKGERLTLALKAGQMGVYDLNLADDQLWWSPEIYALFGVAPEQFSPMRESFNELVHPQDREELWRRVEEAIGNRHLYVHEFRIVRPDGAIRWIANQGQTEYDDRGQPRRHFGIASDITERKEAEEALRRQEEQLRVITDAMPSFIAYVDAGERYRFVNAEYEKWFHRPRHEIVGLSIRELLREGYANSEPFIRRALAGEAVTFERGIRFGGTQRTVQTSYSPDVREDGTVAGFYVLVTDISDRKRHEEELRRWKDELEVRVLQRTRELVDSQERLRALASQLSLTEQRERRKLASDLHDYLAQLLVVGRMKMSRLMRQGVLPPVTEAMVQDVDNILQQVLTYTRTLIADLTPPGLQAAGLPAALKWLAERMRRDGLWVEVSVSRESVPLPEEKALFLFQCVRELLFNVLKHARVDRAVVRLTVEEEGDVRVAVEDEGTGLDPAVLTRAAEPGHFGLLSVRERMEAMGGWMELASASGKGTVVTLVLPRMQ